MPDRNTVFRWLDDDVAFAAKYARARVGQADWAYDGMIDVERGVLDDVIDPQAARVVIGSMQWRASKLAPKKYGERSQMELSGPDGGPIETANVGARDRIATRLAAIRKPVAGQSG